VMTTWKAWWAAMAIWCLFGWTYVCVRIIAYPNAAFSEPFIDGIPISFWMLGTVFFILGFAGTVGALRTHREG
jgi:hypothetical protein